MLNARLAHASVRGLRRPRTQHRQPYTALAHDLRQRPKHGFAPPGAKLFPALVRWGTRVPLALRLRPRTAFAPDLAATGQRFVALAPSLRRGRGAGCSSHRPEPRRRAPSTRSFRRPLAWHTRHGRAPQLDKGPRGSPPARRDFSGAAHRAWPTRAPPLGPARTEGGSALWVGGSGRGAGWGVWVWGNGGGARLSILSVKFSYSNADAMFFI